VWWKRRRHERNGGKGKGGSSEKIGSTESMASTSEERSSSGDLEAPEPQPTVEFTEEHTLVISKGHVRIPRTMYLTVEEKLLLETLSQRL